MLTFNKEIIPGNGLVNERMNYRPNLPRLDILYLEPNILHPKPTSTEDFTNQVNSSAPTPTAPHFRDCGPNLDRPIAL